MEVRSIQRSVQSDSHLIVQDEERGVKKYNGFVKIGNYKYNFYNDNLTDIQSFKNTGELISIKSARAHWRISKEELERGFHVETTFNLLDTENDYTPCSYFIKPNGKIHTTYVKVADYCSKLYPKGLVYLCGVLYFRPKYKIIQDSIPREEVLKDTGFDTAICGSFNPKQELEGFTTFKTNCDLTESDIQKLKDYFISRQIRIDDKRYTVTGY